MSRHRGAKHRRRYELLGGISLLSPEYLLSVERWPFHSEPPDHYRLAVKAGLCHCTNLLMSDQISQPSCSSVTLGGAQTTHQTLSATPVRAHVRTSNIKGYLSAPCRLASTLQSLPPILHIKAQCSVSSYSKGSRGLFRLAAGTLHLHSEFNFTESRVETARHHYAIRAGRNLPDKEFRYLRTVIVTAAVYRGFDQELRVTANPIN